MSVIINKSNNTKKLILRLIIFSALNFGALAIGSIFTGKGVPSDWYTQLNKAPWTPPGWAFGAAWTTIMICFSIYMAVIWARVKNKTQLLVLFILQWLLNVSWNPVFFYYHQMLAGLIVIIALTLVIAIMFLLFSSTA